MPEFVIEREIPGVRNLSDGETPGDCQKINQRSRGDGPEDQVAAQLALVSLLP